MLYPIKLKPVYKDAIWGGTNIRKRFGREAPDERVSESWEVCCRNDGMNAISNGCFEGPTLMELIERFSSMLLGDGRICTTPGEFPLLIKFIDASERLSVQVHPGSGCMTEDGMDMCKNEMWYVIEARPGSRIVYGVKEHVTPGQFAGAVKNGGLQELLNEVTVSPGDVFFIPSGMVHAILEGIMVAEIQQNSNTTYRVYDWDRVGSDGKPRELHIDKALEAVRLEPFRAEIPSEVYCDGSCSIRELTCCEYFTAEEVKLSGSFTHTMDSSRFYIYMAIQGYGTIKHEGGSESISCGETFLIPSSLGQYSLEGELTLLRVYV
jgi:mannose-6-phosphate isomerase